MHCQCMFLCSAPRPKSVSSSSAMRPNVSNKSSSQKCGSQSLRVEQELEPNVLKSRTLRVPTVGTQPQAQLVKLWPTTGSLITYKLHAHILRDTIEFRSNNCVVSRNLCVRVQTLMSIPNRRLLFGIDINSRRSAKPQLAQRASCGFELLPGSSSK